MIPDIVTSCYKNDYGINFRSFHISQCKLGDNEQMLINRINVRSKSRLIFDDGLSDKFELRIYDNLLYLYGDKSCYPCSNVIETVMGEDFNWIRCYVIPSGQQITGETDIRKSAIVVSFYSELIPIIKEEKAFSSFLDNLRFTYKNCEWFNPLELSRLLTFVKFWNYKEKLHKLYEHGLLRPLELAIFNLYNKKNFKTEHFIKHFIESLASSTEKIFQRDEICMFLNTLSSKQLESIFAINEIRENVRLDIIDDDYFADLIHLDGYERHGEFVNSTYYLYYMRERADSLFLFPNFRKDYLKVLNRNLRGLENQLRKSKGFEDVGSFFMEKLLYDRLKNEFPMLTILSQYSPDWLTPQRFDIFIVELDLAIEYNGAQHYNEIDFFGGKKGLVRNQLLDKTK